MPGVLVGMPTAHIGCRALPLKEFCLAALMCKFLVDQDWVDQQILSRCHALRWDCDRHQ